MYFDDYSTSFLSLYKPMYNLQTNYSAYGIPGAGYGTGYAGGYFPFMGGMYNGSLTNVPVGHFGADQLIVGDEARSNYYAAPIAPHKKKDELPTILGIIGTALGTAAMALALAKGRGKGRIKKPTGNVPGGSVDKPIFEHASGPKLLPPHESKPKIKSTSQSTTGSTGTTGTTGSTSSTGSTGATGSTGSTIVPPSSRTVYELPANTTRIAGLLPAHTPSAAEAGVKYGSTIVLPSSGKVYEMPAGTTKISGRLPERTTPVAGLLPAHTTAKAQTPELPPIGDLVYGTKNRFPGVTNYQNFGDDLLNKINRDYRTLKHQEVPNGEIVWTTHTPQTYSDAHSIGANAKGADKLAELLEKLSN